MRSFTDQVIVMSKQRCARNMRIDKQQAGVYSFEMSRLHGLDDPTVRRGHDAAKRRMNDDRPTAGEVENVVRQYRSI